MTTDRLPPTPLLPVWEKTFAEFFAGIGLVQAALQQTGWRCVYANDIDRHKRSLYESHFGPAPHYHLGDVWNTEEVLGRMTEAPFLATASFPCTDMSLAGRQQGFAGPESSAFFGFAQVLQQLARRPPLVLLENVSGLLSARGGADFAAVIQRLAELGYWVDAWCLDARHFVPQSRPRLFIAGVAEPLLKATTMLTPATDYLRWWSRVCQCPLLRPPRLQQAMRELELPTGWCAAALQPPPAASPSLADVVDTDSQQAWWDDAQVRRHAAMMSEPHRRCVEQWREDPSQLHVATVYRRIRQRQQRAEVRRDGLAGCLRTPRGGSARQIVLVAGRGALRMRWMSPREYARLQGADDFRFGSAPDSRVLFGFGDAVCVPAVAWIDRQLLTPLQQAAAPTQQASAPAPAP